MPAFHLRTNVFHSYLKITQNPKGTINVVTKRMLSHFVSDLKITNFIFPRGCKSNDEQRRSERTSKRTKLLSDSAITLWEFSLREEVTLQWSFFFVIVILPQICKKHLQRFDYSTSRSVFAHLLSICSKIPMCCWSRTVHMLGACLSMYQSAKKTKKIINIIVIIILLLYLDIFLPKGPTQLNLHND